MSNLAEQYIYDCKYKIGTRLYVQEYKGRNIIEGASGLVISENDITNRYGKSIDAILRSNRNTLFAPIMEMANRKVEDCIYFYVTNIEEVNIEEYDDIYLSTIINNLVGKVLILSKEDSKELKEEERIEYRVIS